MKPFSLFSYKNKPGKQELRSPQYLGYHKNILIVLSKSHFKNVCFPWSIKITLCYSKFHIKQ